MLDRFKEPGQAAWVARKIRARELDPRVLLQVGMFITKETIETGKSGWQRAEEELRMAYPGGFTGSPGLWQSFVTYHMYRSSAIDPEFGSPDDKDH